MFILRPDHFTNHYKDHGFVIDAEEATKLLGGNIIKEQSKEYQFGNDIYSFLDWVDLILKIFKKKTMRYVGSRDSGMDFNDLKE